MKMNKKGGVMKILVWIVIILIVASVIFLSYKAFERVSSGESSSESAGEYSGQESTGEEQTTEEKPPMPPE
jgi:uncharacterized membrane protein